MQQLERTINIYELIFIYNTGGSLWCAHAPGYNFIYFSFIVYKQPYIVIKLIGQEFWKEPTASYS